MSQSLSIAIKDAYHGTINRCIGSIKPKPGRQKHIDESMLMVITGFRD